ncbi:hypothetical protein LIP_1396 [Limnochorda pilosa]|uniref:Uncharacterized protein n=1 Tax=Limnochorda pilosa TaxID=1555112 RepID=A0A0K2SJR3_LIMPI|nr:hypothetical protein LIP_1396 [Limnochorda pilosa]
MIIRRRWAGTFLLRMKRRARTITTALVALMSALIEAMTKAVSKGSLLRTQWGLGSRKGSCPESGLLPFLPTEGSRAGRWSLRPSCPTAPAER